MADVRVLEFAADRIAHRAALATGGDGVCWSWPMLCVVRRVTGFSFKVLSGKPLCGSLDTYCPRALVRDRRAGNGMLIEGSPPSEMHQAVIGLVHGQTG
jgi:hypothetical protein